MISNGLREQEMQEEEEEGEDESRDRWAARGHD